MFGTSGDVQYIGEYSVHQGETMSTSGGNTISALGDILSYIHRVMFSISGDIMMHVGSKLIKIYIENPDVLNIPQCTHDIPYVLMVYPRCTEHLLIYS